jgi:hypothetical protein
VEKKTLLTAAFISALLLSAAAGARFVNLGKANPLPPMYTEITIKKPLNTTYYVNTVPLIFSVDTDYQLNSYFYSLDGQERKPVENTVILLQEDINLGKNPQITRTVLNGSCVLYNLSEGWHTVTVFQISHLIGGDPEYEIPFSESLQFKIEIPEPDPSPSPQTSPALPEAPAPSSSNSGSLNPPKSEPFSVDLVAASVIVIVVVGAGLLVSFRKHRK